MIVVDLHTDTVTDAMDKGLLVLENNLHCDIKRIKKYEGYINFFAAFIDPIYYDRPFERAKSVIGRIHELEKNIEGVLLCRNINDLHNALKSKKVGIIISIEGGEALEGSLENLEIFYEMGVRSLCPLWNHDNAIGTSAMDNKTNTGLTEFGVRVIKKMNEYGMIVDVSHSSERTFYDIIENINGPLIASHSNSKSLCNHKRNLTDDQLREIKRLGGVVGINFCTDFLSEGKKASIDDIILHIEYIMSLIGEDYVAIGSEFDGIDELPIGITGVESLSVLYEKLLAKNYSEAIANKIFYENAINVLKKTIKKN